MQNRRGSNDVDTARLSYSLKLLSLGMLILLVSGSFEMFELLLVLIPVLVTMASVVSSMLHGIVISAVLSLCAFFISSMSVSLSVVAMLCATGLVTAYGCNRKQLPEKVIFQVTYFLSILFAAISYYYYLVGGERIAKGTADAYREVFAHYPEILTQFERMSRMPAEQFLQQVELMFPAVMFTVFLLVATLNYYMSTALMNRQSNKLIFPRFRSFSMPHHAGLGISLMIITAYLLGYSGFDYSENWSFSIYLITGACMYLQGLATLVFWSGKNLSPVAGNLFLVGAGMFLPWLVILVGFFDTIFPLRRQKQ